MGLCLLLAWMMLLIGQWIISAIPSLSNENHFQWVHDLKGIVYEYICITVLVVNPAALLSNPTEYVSLLWCSLGVMPSSELQHACRCAADNCIISYFVIAGSGEMAFATICTCLELLFSPSCFWWHPVWSLFNKVYLLNTGHQVGAWSGLRRLLLKCNRLQITSYPGKKKCNK